MARREQAREAWELENYKEGEVQEMVEIYEGRGMSRDDAELVIGTMAKYDSLFVNMMVVDELGLSPPDADHAPWKDGAITFASFCFFGIFPLAAYCAFGASGALDAPALLGVSIALTAAMLFVLGAIKSTMTTRSWWASGLEVLAVGAAVASIAYLVGWGIEELIFASSHEVVE